jgi:thioredoxin-related protein
MKKIRFVLLLLTACWSYVVAQGIRFEEIKWSDALARSAKTAKPIFLDAHTAWCGPCKLMAKNVFPNEEVSKFYNENFINLKLDMEKGEGPALAAQYGIDLYPTLLYIAADGSILHRSAGYYAKEAFIELGKVALDPVNNFAGLIKRYNSGDRTPGLLLDLGKIKAAAYDPSAKDLIRYADDPFSDGYQFFIRNKPLFDSKYGAKETEVKIENAVENYLMQHPGMQLGEVQRLYAVSYPEKADRLASSYRLTYFRQQNDMQRFAASAVDHYSKYPSEDADELNELAWLFWQHVNDTPMLEKAIAWAEQSLKIQETWYNNDTLARLYQKTNKKKQAIKTAKRAVEIAAQTGEDASQTLELLKTLEQQK